jgi:hypothetical protein
MNERNKQIHEGIYSHRMWNRLAPLKLKKMIYIYIYIYIYTSDFVFKELRKMLTKIKFIKIVRFFVAWKEMCSLVPTV